MLCVAIADMGTYQELVKAIEGTLENQLTGDLNDAMKTL